MIAPKASYGFRMPCIVVIGFAKLWLGLDNHIATLGPAKLVTASNSEPYNSKLKKRENISVLPDLSSLFVSKGFRLIPTACF